MKNNATLINQTTGNTEYYTPKEIVEAARETMHGIQLDPASSVEANRIIKANRIFTAPKAKIIGELKDWRGIELPLVKFEDEGGLSEKWEADSVWLNHPFYRGEAPCKKGCEKNTCVKRGYHIASSIPSNADWINYAIASYLQQRIRQACIITYAVTSEKWFKQLLQHPQCFLNPRTNYYGPDGKQVTGVTKGSVVTYLGKDVNRFAACYRKFGVIKVAL